MAGNVINLFKLNWNATARMEWEFAAPLPHAVTPSVRNMTYNDDNQLATFNGQAVVYDLDGNMISGPLTNDTLASYTFDARNRLLSAGGLSYAYDPSANRIAITNGADVTRFAVNPNAALSQVLIRTKPDGSKTFYVCGAGLLYEVNETSSGVETGTATYHYDYRGSTVALTDGSGNVTDRIEYSAYGSTTYRTGNTDTPFLFNGRYGVQTDANGLLYMRARYYNPHICRFVNPDPIGFAGGLNFYAYADGNPISYLDPFGLSGWDVAFGTLRVVGGAFEAAAGYSLAAAAGTFGFVTSPTVGGAVVGAAGFVGGAAIGAHGIDQIQAGLRQTFSGQHVDSLTSETLQSVGMSPYAANLTDASISVVGSIGAGFAATGYRAATLASTASSDVANASLLTQMKYYEAGQTSFNSSIFNAQYAGYANTLDRGAAILGDYGSMWGVWRAGSQTLGIAEGTLKYLPTPMANGALGSGLGLLGSGVPSVVGWK